MKKIQAICVVAVLGGINNVAVSATEEKAEAQLLRFQQEIEPRLATKKPYRAPLEADRKPAPEGCELVHINYLGRHGSRHLSSFEDYQEDILQPAVALGLIVDSPDHGVTVNDANTPTERGERLARSIVNLNNTYNKFKELPGSITTQGQQEQELLGERLFQNTGLRPADVKQKITKKGVTALHTVADRTRESRDAFLKGLATWTGTDRSHLNVIEFEPERIDRTLHFYDHCKRYLDQKKTVGKAGKTAIKRLREKERRQTNTGNIADFFMAGLEPEKAQNLTSLIYDLCRLDANMQYTLGVCALLPKGDSEVDVFMRYQSQYANIKQFYKRGPSRNYKPRGLNGNMAVELLGDFLITTQAAIDDDRHPIATLRFAHGATVLRMLQILDVVTHKNSTDDKGRVTWSVQDLAPMSANIAWQTYRCPTNNSDKPAYKIRMLHNEEAKSFPVKGCQRSEFCPWPLVKNYYENRSSGLTLEGVCGELVLQDKTDD